MPNKSGITIYVHKRTGPLRGPPFRRSAIPGVRVRFRVNPSGPPEWRTGIYNKCSVLSQNTAYKSVTDRLVRRLKIFKAVSMYLLDECSSAPAITAAQVRSKCARRRRISTPRQVIRDSNERRIHEGYNGKILQPIDVDRSCTQKL